MTTTYKCYLSLTVKHGRRQFYHLLLYPLSTLLTNSRSNYQRLLVMVRLVITFHWTANWPFHITGQILTAPCVWSVRFSVLD